MRLKEYTASRFSFSLDLFIQQAETNRSFQFQKSSQLIIRAHDEPLSVAAMCVSIDISQVTPRTNRHKIARNQRRPKVILPLITQRQKPFSYQLIGSVKLL
jgi:hypothetical protein